jgi:hypothetical protein
MSNNPHQQNSQKFSKVRIVSANHEKLVKQDYKDVLEIKSSLSEGISPTIDFNYNLENYPKFIFVFLAPIDNFINEHVVSKIMGIFNKYPIVSAIYTDLYMIGEGQAVQFLPSASYQIFDRQIINAPIFFKPSSQEVRFDTRLEHLYFHDFFLKIRNSHLMYHVAEPLITRRINNIDIRQDMQLIKNAQSKT